MNTHEIKDSKLVNKMKSSRKKCETKIAQAQEENVKNPRLNELKSGKGVGIPQVERKKCG